MLFSGCTKDEERPENYFEVNGEKYKVPLGYIDDDGTNSEITYRNYDIKICDQLDKSRAFFLFTIKSNSTTRLEEGTYSYSYSYKKGVFSTPTIGFDVVYDERGQAISGTRIKESQMSNIQGSVQVSQEEGDYKFTIDFSFTYNNESYVVKGQFWDTLKTASL